MLKITDNTTVGCSLVLCCRIKLTIPFQCIKFKTNSSIFLNRFESLNLSLMQKMQNQRPKEDPGLHAAPELLPTSEHDRTSPLPAQASSSIPTQVPSAGGVKKKKPKKKK